MTKNVLTIGYTRTSNYPLRSKFVACEPERSPALRSGERGRGSGIRLSARRRANKRLEQTLRAEK
ncbi:hypothetical protein B9H02_11280 [Prosthecochloris sp. HL-130-GSB]|nr:hypothetical protein B9H02_11280 [Prosthecochloris sp. HL-130-GSB]